MNLADLILKHIILNVFTKDEWHTIVIGFFDGLSFSNEGRYMTKALSRKDIVVDGIKNEKIWYYKAPYAIGEISKVGFFVLIGAPFFN